MKEKSCPHCGGLLHMIRSEPDHRRFFALLSAAYENWPEHNEFQPDNREHLRKYLICAAGYRESVDIALPYSEDEPSLAKLAAISMEAAIRAAGAYAFVRPDPAGGRVAVYRARSIAWDTIGQREFAEVRSAVEDVIEAQIGVTAFELLKSKETAA